MSITGALVLFTVIWFMLMFIILPIRLRTQGEAGEVVPGTHAGAPEDFRLGRTMLIVTLWAVPVWAIIAGIIISGVITVEMLDWNGYMGERTPN